MQCLYVFLLEMTPKLDQLRKKEKKKERKKEKRAGCLKVVVHTLNPNTKEAEADGSL